MESQRVRVTRNIDLDYMGVLHEGERGTIVAQEWDAGKLIGADIRMDKPHKGLRDWDNVAHLIEPEVDNVAVIKSSFLYQHGTRLVTYAAAAAIAFLATVGGWEIVFGDDVTLHIATRAAHAAVRTDNIGVNISHGQPQEAAGRPTENSSAVANGT